MFSSEAVVTMANGTYRSISLVRINDLIMNKFFNPCKVTRITHNTGNSVSVQLDNDTDAFFTDADALFMCNITEIDSSKTVKNDTISNIFTNGYKLKNSGKFFSPESEVSIIDYDDTPVSKTLYCLYTNDKTQTYLINQIVTACET